MLINKIAPNINKISAKKLSLNSNPKLYYSLRSQDTADRFIYIQSYQHSLDFSIKRSRTGVKCPSVQDQVQKIISQNHNPLVKKLYLSNFTYIKNKILDLSKDMIQSYQCIQFFKILIYCICQIMQQVPILTFHDGGKIPILGVGTAHNSLQGIQDALKVGYRHIDSAHYYKVQHVVAQAIKNSGIPRSQLFITSKVWKTDFTKEKTIASLNQTLNDLDTSYVDLLLMHWPYVDGINPKDGEALKNARIQVWKTFIQFKNQGLVKHIGVSNFLPKHIQQLIDATGQKPVVNQIINHPFKVLEEVIDYCKKQDILIQAWSPLGQQRHSLLINPIIEEIADKYKKTTGQVILRWVTQHGYITFPKSENMDRLRENLQIFNFLLQENDMKKIDEMHLKKTNVDEFQIRDMYVQ